MHKFLLCSLPKCASQKFRKTASEDQSLNQFSRFKLILSSPKFELDLAQ